MSRHRIVTLAGTVLLLSVVLLAGARPLQAQDAEPATSTTRTTLVPGEAAVTPEGSPRNNAGLVVGAVAVGAIVIGATVLYLRYRGRGNTAR